MKIGAILIGALYLVAFGGWVANIFKLVGHLDNIGNVEILRAIGILVAPLGSILGLFV